MSLPQDSFTLPLNCFQSPLIVSQFIVISLLVNVGIYSIRN